MLKFRFQQGTFWIPRDIPTASVPQIPVSELVKHPSSSHSLLLHPSCCFKAKWEIAVNRARNRPGNRKEILFQSDVYRKGPECWLWIITLNLNLRIFRRNPLLPEYYQNITRITLRCILSWGVCLHREEH